MRLGPLDRRLERTRCLSCAKSHLKCSAGTRCTNCFKRNLQCVYPQKNTATMGIQLFNPQTPRSEVCLRISQKPNFDHSNEILKIFLTRFVSENDFTGLPSTWFLDIQTHFATDMAVHHAIKALSALYACQKDSTNRLQNQRLALKSYQTAVLSVKKVINGPDARIEQPLLSSTFLLGLFELMYDPTGQGWIKHTMYGTSKLVQFLGPEAFRSGLGLSFFTQTKMFEVSRCLIFSESSFLIQKPWMELHYSSDSSESDTHPLDDLLDLMIKCSDHCARALSYLQGMNETALSSVQIQQLRSFSLEGFELRLALDGVDSRLLSLPFHLTTSSRTLIAKVYFAATSIFLSGIYDYRSVWLRSIEAVPTLSQYMIEYHVNTILEGTEYAMQQTNLSKLLFLYPLRVACARVYMDEQKQRLRKMFGLIQHSFAVADVFRTEVEELWRTPILERYT
ncbi:uncharacterized protein M437DRAFT_77211 [Aureobasidium melanogenum CBS 110374]|uniref:Zn(2)-C6 fungal-type domain-containing protein n=1 Tax=Aureobasidium melanogenum (strain CBS 110374) TaxID=1043003 RepID=A0A074WDB0_AURM1|nr:uncharacterized protein M437DRAFT_77211 [Aureobasidium melanogenum CBS 110374]KEQ60476.1 hypothetical protein M437DRAFT_77211 [Aureobasidium melanogenum CBS 110374]